MSSLSNNATAAASLGLSADAFEYIEQWRELFMSSLIMVCAMLVILLQPGFALFEAGLIRLKNLKTVLALNILDCFLGIVIFFSIGWGIAAGPDGTWFSGGGEFALYNMRSLEWSSFAMMFASVITCSTIISGVICERTTVTAYLVQTLVVCGLQYPFFIHWTASSDGFLAPRIDRKVLNTIGFLDFAGGASVHTLGALTGLTGAIIAGPRTGRFLEDGTVTPMTGHSTLLYGVGVLILVVGWLPFNLGSLLVKTRSFNASPHVIQELSGLVFTNTLLMGGAGMLTPLLVARLRRGSQFDLGKLMACLLGAMCSSSACAIYVQPWAAVVIGMGASVIVTGVTRLLLYLKLDDVCEAVPVHICGAWGVFSIALFAPKSSLREIYGVNPSSWGLLYGGGGSLLLVQLVGLLLLVAMAVLPTAAVLFALKKLGTLRYSLSDEIRGQDIVETGEPALEMLELEDALIHNEWDSDEDDQLFARPWAADLHSRDPLGNEYERNSGSETISTTASPDGVLRRRAHDLTKDDTH